MSWLYEKWDKVSEKNGLITCKRWFGRWSVWVEGYAQSGPYNTKMFYDAIKKIPSDTHIKHALILGLGGGSIVKPLIKHFSDIEITFIEWDPVMIEVAQQIQMFTVVHQPKILLGDVGDILPKLKEKYDLIIVDLFRGPIPNPQMSQESFCKLLQAVSHKKTFVLLNAFRSQELIDLFAKTFNTVQQWRFQYNVLGLYQNAFQPSALQVVPSA